LIPLIGPLFLAGWGLELTRRVIAKESEPLPEWNDFGGYIVKGIQLIVIGFVYTLPVILVQSCSQGLLTAGMDNFGNDETFMAVYGLAQFCIGCPTFLYSLFLGFFMPAAIAHFAAEGSLGAAFRFAEIFRIIKAGPAAYIIIVLASIVMPFIAMLGLMFCLVGALFTFPYAMTVMHFLYGEAYRACKETIDMGYDKDLKPDAPPIAGA